MRTARLLGLLLSAEALCTAAHGATLSEQAADLLLTGRCEAAIDPLNAAIKAGEPQAYLLTGLMYHRGFCVKPDPARAVPFLELAARGGEAEAAKQLTLIHGLGRSVPQDFRQAGRWAVAYADIAALRSAAAAPASGATATVASPLDADTAMAYGRLVTIHARAHELFELDWRALKAQGSFLVKVTLTPPSAIDYDLSDMRRWGDRSNPDRRRMIESSVDRLKQAYTLALREVPSASTQTCDPVSQEYLIRIE